MHKCPFVYVVSLILPLSYFSIHKFHINPQTLENSGRFRGGEGGRLPPLIPGDEFFIFFQLGPKRRRFGPN